MKKTLLNIIIVVIATSNILDIQGSSQQIQIYNQFEVDNPQEDTTPDITIDNENDKMIPTQSGGRIILPHNEEDVQENISRMMRESKKFREKEDSEEKLTIENVIDSIKNTSIEEKIRESMEGEEKDLFIKAYKNPPSEELKKEIKLMADMLYMGKMKKGEKITLEELIDKIKGNEEEQESEEEENEREEEDEEYEKFKEEFKHVLKLKEVYKETLEYRKTIAGKLASTAGSIFLYTTKWNNEDQALYNYTRKGHRTVSKIETAVCAISTTAICIGMAWLLSGLFTGGLGWLVGAGAAGGGAAGAGATAAAGATVAAGTTVAAGATGLSGIGSAIAIAGVVGTTWILTNGSSYVISKVADVFCGEGGILSKSYKAIINAKDFIKKEWNDAGSIGKIGIGTTGTSIVTASILGAGAAGGGALGAVAGGAVAIAGGGAYAFCRKRLNLGIVPSSIATTASMCTVGYIIYKVKNKSKTEREERKETKQGKWW